MKESEIRASNLFLSNHGFVAGVAFRYAPLPGFNEDIVQQVFAEFVGHADRWDLDADVRPLLVRITQNVARRYWREQTRKMPEVLRQIAERARRVAERNAELDAEQPRETEEIAALRRCVKKLPAKSREIIHLHYFNGMTMRDIAKEKQTTDAAVRRAFCDLRKKLHACMKRREQGQGSREQDLFF